MTIIPCWLLLINGWFMDGIVGFDQITNSFNNHGFHGIPWVLMDG